MRALSSETYETPREVGRRRDSNSRPHDSRGHTLNRLVPQPVPPRSLGSGTGRRVPGRSLSARHPGVPSLRRPPPPAFRGPRPLTRSSSARSSARRMRCPRQRPPSPAQAAHTGRRSEQQNQLRAWPCSGHSGPDPGPALSADMAERPAPRAPPVAGDCWAGPPRPRPRAPTRGPARPPPQLPARLPPPQGGRPSLWRPRSPPRPPRRVRRLRLSL